MVLLLALPWSIFSESGSLLEAGKFSAVQPGDTFPDGWNPLTFKTIERHTQYRLVKDGDDVVVMAESIAASSGLSKEVTIDPKEYPIVQWRWKVANLIEKSDTAKKAGDDYAARLYITFAYDPKKVGMMERAKFEAARMLYGQYPPVGAINYIWATKEPKGRVVPNPYTDRAMMIVVQTGADGLNTWLTEERNLYKDYKQAFKEEPPMISGVAIMTDTDNTGESATAYYGDIVFKKASVN